jgi:hypothetical protein
MPKPPTPELVVVVSPVEALTLVEPALALLVELEVSPDEEPLLMVTSHAPRSSEDRTIQISRRMGRASLCLGMSERVNGADGSSAGHEAWEGLTV